LYAQIISLSRNPSGLFVDYPEWGIKEGGGGESLGLRVNNPGLHYPFGQKTHSWGSRWMKRISRPSGIRPESLGMPAALDNRGPVEKIPLNVKGPGALAISPSTDSPYVFPGRGGRKRVDINHQVNQIKEAAGILRYFRALHGLRHVYASMLASSGQVDLYTLQKLLTHKSSTMTQRYAHLRDQALRKAADLAGNIIEQFTSGPTDSGMQF
jgi:hypothetical protein